MPRIKKINTGDINVDGTSLRGHLYASYDQIVSKLGEPHYDGDGYKTDAEWDIEFDNGEVATIYNWKNGKNYCGEDGYSVENISEWHIGGFNNNVEIWINDYILNSWPVFDDIRQQAQI